jgi:hypothetical protein
MRISTTAVAAVAALALASGGVGYAAGSLPKNSVASKQIKNGSVRTTDLKNNAITSGKVKDNGLTGADIDESTLTMPGKGGTVLLTGLDFVPSDSATTYTSEGHGELSNFGAVSYFSAPVDAPLGSRVTKIEVFVRDIGPGNIRSIVSRYAPASDTTDDLTGFVDSVGSPATVQTLTHVLSATVSAGTQMRIQVLPGTGASYEIIGALVTYTFAAPLPDLP